MTQPARATNGRIVLAASVLALVVPFAAGASTPPTPPSGPPTTAAPTTAAPTTEPTTTAPATAPATEPPATEPPTTTTEPATTEPASTQPASTEPQSSTEPASTEPGASTPATPEVTETTESGVIVPLVADPTGTIAIDKTNTADGEPAGDGGTVEPGDSYTYNFLASCSNINVDCVNLTVVDTFPADVIVDASTIPASIAGFRDVTWDGTTLTVVYIQPLANPPGATGKIAGTSDNFTVSVTFPADTTLETGTVITNEATVSADNVAESATDPSDVVVNIPRIVDVETSKSFSDPSAIAGDPDATTTIQIAADNLSSSSAEVTEMVIEDSTADTWEYLDFVSATVTQYPAGADQAQLFVCPEASAPCDDSEWVAGGTGAPPGPSDLALPGTVAADEVVGVRVVFTDTDGSFIEPVAGGGTAAIDIETDLRDTVRSTGQTIVSIPTTTTVDNVATTTVTDPGADPSSATDSDDAQYQILPPTLSVDPSKSFFPDANGNFQTDAGEHAVIGENSGVSMIIGAQNTSAFPVAEIVITEPSANPNDPVSEFDKFDPVSFALTFPEGADNANVVVTYDDGTSTTTDHTPPGPGTVVVGPGPPKVTSITVTFTGPDADGDGEPDPTIVPGATAGLNIHGNLNDNVDASDVAGAVDNCAGFTASGGGVPGTTGTFVGNSCDPLPIEERNPNTGGEKVASQTEIPPDQPVLFTMTTTNNGNLPLFNVVVADPPLGADGTPALSPTFTNLRFLDAFISNDNVDAPITLEVYVPGSGWVAYPGPGPSALRLVTGVRATIPVLAPLESFNLNVAMQLRYISDPDFVLENCYGITASGGEFEAQNHCAPPLTPTGLEESATLNKFISPETVPERIPGMDPADAEATVQLRVENTGSLTAKFLQITDNDTEFWDAVDFVRLGAITPPATGALARADRIQIDAFVGGVWVDGTPTPIGSAALPAGVTPEDVRGLRFTFSDTSTLDDGYVITPCEPTAPPGECTGVVEFVVVPRLTLLSTGEPLPETLDDTATGAFDTQLSPSITEIPPVTDDLTFVPGDPQLDVNKTPEAATVQPGQLATFNLVTTNNGTANLPDLTVSDPLPTGILFDDTFADPDTGEPFTVTWSNLPVGYPEPPAAVSEASPDPNDPSRIGLVRWTFPGFDMPPNSTVTIFFRYTLEPGVTAGQEITNTMGASSPVEDLGCTDPDVVVNDGAFGAGTYCTDPAGVTVTAGANFASRKWVAGNPSLGWYNVNTGELVPIGGAGCLSLAANGRTYTTNPCIALVNPGEPFYYVLRVQNAGTEDALQMTIIDTFPAPGDTGVLGAARGTEWATAPTLAGPAVYSGPATGEIGYTSGTACTDDLFLDQPPCPAGAWSEAPGASTTALRLAATFAPDPLPPGGAVDVSFTMNAPAEVPHVSDPTIAWNSIAHAEITEPAPGQERVLAPLEPLKVGVATMYGGFEVVKEIGANPGDLPLEDLEFTFDYECVQTNGVLIETDPVAFTVNEPGIVEELPAGATCEVWETEINGGVPSATADDPATVVIEPSLTEQDPVLSSVTITNDFPLGRFEVLKAVTGGADEAFTGGPYPVVVDCQFFVDESLPGFPVEVDLVPGIAQGVDVPVGTVCGVEELDSAGAFVSYDPPGVDGTFGEAQVPADGTLTATVTITNDFVTGSLVIEKTVSGPGAPAFSVGPFEFDITCDYLGNEDVFSTTVVVPGSTDGTPVQSDPVTGLPIGAECTVTETDSGGADLIAPPTTVTIEENEEANVAFVGIDNPFSAGTIAVAKLVDGSAAESDYVSGLSFTVHVECALEDLEGNPIPVYEGDVTVAGDGVPVVANGADGVPAPLPLGTRCWGSEPATGGATDVTIDHDSFANGVEVVADAAAGTQQLLITVTNTYELAQLTVSKVVVNEPTPGAVYSFSIACTIEDAGGIIIDAPLLSGEPEFTLGDGESATFDVLTGSTCTVTETDAPAGATVTMAESSATSDDDPTDGTVTADPTAAIVVTNTYELAQLTVSKVVVNEPTPGAVYSFSVACTIEDAGGIIIDAPLLSGEPEFTLGDGESATFDVLTGSTCTVTETNVATGATVTMLESGGATDGTGTDGTITVGPAASVVVTNTFEPAILPRTR